MYLLASQTLFDLICGHPNVTAWASATPLNQVGISAVSLGVVAAEVERTSAAAGRAQLDSNLRKAHGIARRLNRVEGFGEAEAAAWAGIMDMGLRIAIQHGQSDLGDPSRMVVATALTRGLTLVERAQPYHGVLTSLPVVDPYR